MEEFERDNKIAHKNDGGFADFESIGCRALFKLSFNPLPTLAFFDL